MPKKRKFCTAEEKVAIIRRHLIDQIPVSKLCEEHSIQPTIFYRWQKTFFENGALAFQSKTGDGSRKTDMKVLALEAKLQAKNEVISELMEEHVALKKSLGGI